MAIYKATAYCAATAAGGTRYFAARRGNLDTDPSTHDNGLWDVDVTADGSVTIGFSQSTTGLTPPSAPNEVIVQLREADTDTILTSKSFSPGTADTYVTIYATHNGLSTGTPVIGDYRVYLQVRRTDLGTYDVNSDAQNTKGVIRINPSSMTLTSWHTGPSDPASWGDSLMLDINMSHGFMLDRPHRHFRMEAKHSDTGAVYATDVTEGTDPQSGEIAVTDVFPAGEVPVDIDAVVVAMPSAIAPDSEPDATWIIVPSATTGYINPKQVRVATRIPVNASIDVWHHLQLNDNVPDVTKGVTPKQKLTSDLGFVGFRLTNARGEGLNGITANERLDDFRGLVTPAFNRTVTTATLGVEAGWSNLVAWDSQLPGGAWTHRVDITTATADDNEVNNTEDFVLLAFNPNFKVIVGVGVADEAEHDDHWHPGDPLLIGVGLLSMADQNLVTPLSGVGYAPRCMIGRFRSALGTAEYLDANYDWKIIPPEGTSLYKHPMTQSPTEGRIYTLTIPSHETEPWSPDSLTLFVVGELFDANGTPYSSLAMLDPVAQNNRHSGYQIDPIAFALHGVIGNR